MSALTGKKLLVTGVTGMVAKPVALALAAAGNEVYGAARFADPAARAEFEQAGVHTVRADLEQADFAEVPTDVDHVLNFAVPKTGSFDRDLSAAEGVGFLLEHCSSARSFLHCSSTAVYEPNGHHAFVESDPLGDSHRVMGGPMVPYSICKIAAETVVRYACRRFEVPVTIARLNVPYGNGPCWPFFQVHMMKHGMAIAVHSDRPTQYTPIHTDDIVASIPKLLAAASVPATIVNWGGDEVVSVEEWCTFLGELTGLTPTFEYTDKVLPSVIPDLTKMHSLGIRTTVHWKDGFRRMAETCFPDLVAAANKES